jgi:hypothetical protein
LNALHVDADLACDSAADYYLAYRTAQKKEWKIFSLPLMDGVSSWSLASLPSWIGTVKDLLLGVQGCDTNGPAISLNTFYMYSTK